MEETLSVGKLPKHRFVGNKEKRRISKRVLQENKGVLQ